MKAFSLIELIVIVAIISSLLAISIPTIERFFCGLKLNLAANDVSSQLYLAQKTAQSTKTTCGAKFDSVDKIITVSGKEIKFSPSGSTAFAGNGTISISNKYNRIKKVIVSTAGRIRIE